MLYNSAVKNVEEQNNIDELNLTDLDHFESGGNFAFRHNLISGPHKLFEKADVIYTEPAWYNGYQKFMEKAGIEATQSEYKEYLTNMILIIKFLDIPAYILMGKSMMRTLEPPEYAEIDFLVHHMKAIIGYYNGAKPIPDELLDTEKGVGFIARNYNYVLDFNCGFGNTARICKDNNTNFICSDVNGKCIDYIAKKFMGKKG